MANDANNTFKLTPDVTAEPVMSRSDLADAQRPFGEILPAGDYRVKCTKLEGVIKQFANGAVRRAEFVLDVIEPVEFHGRRIYHSVQLYSAGEDRFITRKRVQTLIESGMLAADSSPEEFAKFDWSRFAGWEGVYRLGHRIYEKDGEQKMTVEAADVVGMHDISRWSDKEWCQPAPQEWKPRIDKRKNTSGGSNGTAAGGKTEIPDDV